MIERYASTPHAVTIVLDAPAQCVAQVFADLPDAGSVLLGPLFVRAPAAGSSPRRAVAIAAVPGARGYRVEAYGISDAWTALDPSRDPRHAWIVASCAPCGCCTGLQPLPGTDTQRPTLPPGGGGGVS